MLPITLSAEARCHNASCNISLAYNSFTCYTCSHDQELKTRLYACYVAPHAVTVTVQVQASTDVSARPRYYAPRGASFVRTSHVIKDPASYFRYLRLCGLHGKDVGDVRMRQTRLPATCTKENVNFWSGSRKCILDANLALNTSTKNPPSEIGPKMCDCAVFRIPSRGLAKS